MEARVLTVCAVATLIAGTPASADSINSNVTVNSTIEESVLSATGAVRSPIKEISDIKMGGVALSEERLKSTGQLYFLRKVGKSYVPSHVFVSDPTTGAGADSLYKKYGWAPVTAVLTPVNVTIHEATSKPVTLLSEPFVNDSRNEIVATGSLQDQLSDSLSWSWNSSDTIAGEQAFEYKRDFAFFGEMTGTSKLSISGTVGESGTEALNETVVTTANVSQALQPGESVDFVISASRGELTADITHEITFTGNIFFDFAETCDGHHHYRVPINTFLGDDFYKTFLGIPYGASFDRAAETVELEYYTNISTRAVTPTNISN